MDKYGDDHNNVVAILYALSPQEAVEVIVLLSAHLADVPLAGRMSGACPTVNVVDQGQIV